MSERMETGPVRFGDDWAGVFIRGDAAQGYAMAIAGLLLRAGPAEDFVGALDDHTMEGLASLLVSCREPCENATTVPPCPPQEEA